MLSSDNYFINEENATIPLIDLLAYLTLNSNWESFKTYNPGNYANIILEQVVALFPLSLYYWIKDTVINDDVLDVVPDNKFNKFYLFLNAVYSFSLKSE